jgi:DNA-binding SARP family transcriptional activator
LESKTKSYLKAARIKRAHELVQDETDYHVVGGSCPDAPRVSDLMILPEVSEREEIPELPVIQSNQVKSGADDNLHPVYPSQPGAIDILGEFQRRFQTVREQLNQLTEALSREEYLVRQMHSELLSLQGAAVPNPKLEVTPQKYRLEIYCLGVFKVCSLTRQIQQWQSNRAKSVFEYLIGKYTAPVSRDILMEALWPDYGSRAAANNLKTAIHDLRQNLSPLFVKTEYPSILFSRDGYFINPEIELWIDAEEFESFWNQGKHLEKEGKTEDAMRKFEKAEALYQGDYLEDSLYGEWTISRRETLKDIYLLIVNKLADYSMHTDDYENCITYCHKILEKDNCREDTYRMLMSSYSRLGQKNNALRWYENCRQILYSELGTPPSQETSALLNRLKRDETI